MADIRYLTTAFRLPRAGSYRPSREEASPCHADIHSVNVRVGPASSFMQMADRRIHGWAIPMRPSIKRRTTSGTRSLQRWKSGRWNLPISGCDGSTWQTWICRTEPRPSRFAPRRQQVKRRTGADIFEWREAGAGDERNEFVHRPYAPSREGCLQIIQGSQ